jgi:hypothetical protein
MVGFIIVSTGVNEYMRSSISDFITDRFNYSPLTSEENPYPFAATNIPYASLDFCLELGKLWMKDNQFAIIEDTEKYIKFRRAGEYSTMQCIKFTGELSAIAIFSTRYTEPDRSGNDLAARLRSSFQAFAFNRLNGQNWFNANNHGSELPEARLAVYRFNIDLKAINASPRKSEFPAFISTHFKNNGYLTSYCAPSACAFSKPGVDVLISLDAPPPIFSLPVPSRIPKADTKKSSYLEPESYPIFRSSTVSIWLSPVQANLIPVLDIVKNTPGFTYVDPVLIPD